jgi:hypothetical protein
MLPLGDVTSPSATTVPAGTDISVGAGGGGAVGVGLAECPTPAELAPDGFADAVGVWRVWVGVAFRCAPALNGTHPARTAITRTASTPDAARRPVRRRIPL